MDYRRRAIEREREEGWFHWKTAGEGSLGRCVAVPDAEAGSHAVHLSPADGGRGPGGPQAARYGPCEGRVGEWVGFRLSGPITWSC